MLRNVVHMNDMPVGSEYAEHLTDADLRLLASATRAPAAAASGDSDVEWLRRNPEALPDLLGDPKAFAAVFGHTSPREGLTATASPFLAFAVAVHRAAAELESMDYVPERSGSRQRVPLFDAPELRDFLGSPARKLFLAELLGSFTRNASGRYRVRGHGQQRTRRFSDLDPVRLAGLLDSVPEADRPGVYRRLGDVALFLTGVFPDYAETYALGPISVTRLLRVAGIPAAQRDRLSAAPAIELLEHLGAHWYRAACSLAPVRTARLAVVAEVADRFRQARRVLNHIADHRLFAQDNPWLSPPA
jgi:hypothetical protein